MNTKKKSVNNKKLTNDFEAIAKKLRDEIISGIRMPRERLIEKDLSTQFSANRMVIRQALQKLESDGLVVIEPYKGAYVTPMSVEKIKENYQIMAMLMSYALKLSFYNLSNADISELKSIVSAQKKLDKGQAREWELLNRRFHKIIYMKCGNQKLIDMIYKNAPFISFWFIYLSYPDRIFANTKEHEKIIEAIQKKDIDQACKLMEEHLSSDKVLNSMNIQMTVGNWGNWRQNSISI